MIWTLIFVGVPVLLLAILVYLVNRFCKFALIRRLAGGRKALRVGIASLAVAGIAFCCYVFMDMINMAIILVHLAVIWAICDALCWLLNRCGVFQGRMKTGGGFRERPESTCYWAGILALAITAAYLSYGWYQAHHVWEKDYRIETEKKIGTLRIVQFADSHVGTTFDAEGFAKHLERMQALNPDVVVITGDYVDDDTSREDMVASCKALGTLKTTYGVYFAPGNHDRGYYAPEYRGYSGDELLAELEKNGVHVLQDEVAPVGDGFYIIGRKDRSQEAMGGSRAEMEELMRGLDAERFSVVLDHQPYDYANQEAAGADLVLSGHTHGGHMFPVNYLGEWAGAYEMVYGHRRQNDTHYIVTSGISDWAIQFKTGCRSEFVVVDIVGSDGAA